MKKNISDIDIKIETALEKVLQVQRVLLWDVAKDEKLSPIQIQFIIFLSAATEENRNISSLAIEFDLTKATVSDAVTSLEKKEILKKYQKSEDKRSFLLDLTEKGKECVKRVNNWKNVLLEHISEFDKDQKTQVINFLTNLIKSLVDSSVISIARMCLTCSNYVKINKDNQLVHYCRLTNEEFSDNDIAFECNYYQAKQA